jgi:hypothetical protein
MRRLTDRARKSGQSLKQAVNDVVSRGLAAGSPQEPVDLPSWDMGRPLHPIDRAWEIEQEMDVASVRHALERGS